MAEKTTPAKDSPQGPPVGERIAKVLSRAGVASRREAERMIELGQVTVNGKIITSPALNVSPKDRITVNGQPLAEAEPARLWLYYKPEGLVTSNSDEKGRDTVFDNLPEDLPRVMSIGRLDLNSEGLLLLTNDGELKRRLELPSTGWLRKYRVRINGNPTEVDLEPLRKGITVDGERFQPMLVVLDKIQGANAWLTIGLREGKNREIRRALNAIHLTVNRLIRISYGPFRLGDLNPGDVEEVRGKVLRDQLGEGPTPADAKPATRLRTGSATRPARAPGAGLRELSDAWTEATTAKPGGARAKVAIRKPRNADDPAPKPRSMSGSKPVTRKPRETDNTDPTKRARVAPATKPFGRTVEKTTAKPAAKTGEKPVRPSAPKPADRDAAARKPGGAARKPVAGLRGKPGPRGGKGE